MFNTVKSAVKPFTVSLALAATLGIASSPASAMVTLDVDSNGVLQGASGILVNGGEYDVSFMDGSLNDIYTNSGRTWVANSEAESTTFAAALLGQVFLDSATNKFDSLGLDENNNRSFTNGCTNTGFCNVLNVHAYDSMTNEFEYTIAGNKRYEASDDLPVWHFDGAFDFTAYDGVTIAVWSESTVAAVPEPSTYAMMAMGLFGIAGLRRRQNKA